MGTTADKLNRLLQTKQEIKQAIIDKGVDISDEDTFASYPEKISSIQGGGDGVNWFDIFTNGGKRGEYLFHGCTTITELDLSDLNTNEMKKMEYMFSSCLHLTELDLSNFNTSGVLTMYFMFSSCGEIKHINISSFNTSAVTTMGYMFYKCSSLEAIDVSHFDLSEVTNIVSMFEYCESLTSLNCDTWDISHITSASAINGAFNRCTKLVDFYPPQNINANMVVDKSNALSHDSLLRILNNLLTVTTTKTLTLGATNLAKLTDEEKAIATDKGWTLK